MNEEPNIILWSLAFYLLDNWSKWKVDTLEQTTTAILQQAISLAHPHSRSSPVLQRIISQVLSIQWLIMWPIITFCTLFGDIFFFFRVWNGWLCHNLNHSHLVFKSRSQSWLLRTLLTLILVYFSTHYNYCYPACIEASLSFICLLSLK